MIIERAFTLIHNLDIPENKRKYWQQWSTIVISHSGEIIDVIKHFEWPNEFLHRGQMELYPHSIQCTAKSGEMFTTIEELKANIEDAVRITRDIK